MNIDCFIKFMPADLMPLILKWHFLFGSLCQWGLQH